MSKRVAIIGSTGMVGGEVLKQCLSSKEVSEVIAIDRSKLLVENKKLKKIQHNNFLDYTKLKGVLTGIDVVYYCIGVYTGAVPEKEFTKVTVDYTKACADSIKKYSPKATFCFLSGAGADVTEKSNVLFARTKGIAENYLIQKQFKRLQIFRPGYIYPSTPRKEPNLMYVISRKLSFLFRWFYPNAMITSKELGKVIFDRGMHPTDTIIYENKDMREYLRK